MKIHTSQIGYEGTRKELVLDTTYKTGFGLGKVFAPEKELVWLYKNQKIDWLEYRERYLKLLRSRYADNSEAFTMVLEGVDDLVLMCYCKAGKNCHRLLLADALVKIALNHGIEAKYVGEKEPRLVKQGHLL